MPRRPPERLRFVAGVGGTLGIILVFFGLFLLSSNISFPLTLQMVAALMWMLFAAAGALALLAYSAKSRRYPSSLIAAGLTCGNLMGSIALVMAPILVVVIFLVIGISALVMSDLYGRKVAILFAIVPVVALLVASRA